MKLLFLGSGSAFTVGMKNYQSNMIFINNNNEKLLIDCGTDARFSLFNQNLFYSDILNVYISHLHADHVGGMEGLALTHYFNGNNIKPNLYICEKLRKEIWNKTLSGGLNTLSGTIATLDTYFNVHAIPNNGTFSWENAMFKIFQTVHIIGGFSLMPSFGLLCNINNKNILITTDTQFNPHQFMPLYKSCDLIFHDCETSVAKSGVHAHYEQLKKLPNAIKEKMWLYHYNPGVLPNAIKDGFCGFVTCGQTFDLDLI